MGHNDEHYTKQLSLDFNAVKGDKVKAVVIDFSSAREKKGSSTKEKAIKALLKEAERLMW